MTPLAMKLRALTAAIAAMVLFATSIASAQFYDPPDRGQPGDPVIQAYLARQASKVEARWPLGAKSLDDWQKLRPQLREQYFTMLGLWPLPEKSPLQATITRSMPMDGYSVDMIHFQSRPGLYVTGNLYRPENARSGERLPAVLYVCGHSNQGRSGNKSAYQSHGIWFARHGYVCLTIDTLQLGEVAGVHHGTYNLGRWNWHSRGYTPAGVECWNGIRAIDYLQSRDDVDAERIGVTGISGGGAATFWIAAADERAKVAVPISGMCDLESLVGNRVINGHCDCMFLYNNYQWPWALIGALVAPRPMMFANSDADPIFPMDANERISNRLERLYSWYGASDRLETMVSVGGHDYRKDLRQAAFRFINTHLKGDPRPIEDSEIDIAIYKGKDTHFPIPPEMLRVFPTNGDLPQDSINAKIDEQFVAVAERKVPSASDFESWKNEKLAFLHSIPLRQLPDSFEPAKLIENRDGTMRLETELGIEVRLTEEPSDSKQSGRFVVAITGDDGEISGKLRAQLAEGDRIFVLHARGTGAVRWTRKNGPNYAERSLALLGQTADTGRIWDIIAAVKFIRQVKSKEIPIVLAGESASGVLAAYAASLCDDVSECILVSPPGSHTENEAPQLLSVLRGCDVEDVLSMLAPRKLTIVSDKPFAQVKATYESLGAGNAISTR
jgi:dienelactone hydrolase